MGCLQREENKKICVNFGFTFIPICTSYLSWHVLTFFSTFVLIGIQFLAEIFFLVVVVKINLELNR